MIDKNKCKLVFNLLKAEKVESEIASPNFVEDFARNRNINLTAKEVVYISNKY